MKSARLGLLLLVLVGASATSGGCAGARMLKGARRAERRGEYIRAYDLYSTAGKQSPKNSAVASGLGRVSSRAARAWHRRARQAERAGDYVRAWQRYMQALRCRPDARAPLDRIRTLERVNPDVQVARQRYLVEGISSLIAAHAPPNHKPIGTHLALSKPGPAVDQGQQEPDQATLTGSTPD